jgi:cell division protein FtsL
MPLESILFLALSLAALVVFAAALIYAEWATRHLMRESAEAETRFAAPAEKPVVTAQPHIHEKAA